MSKVWHKSKVWYKHEAEGDVTVFTRRPDHVTLSINRRLGLVECTAVVRGVLSSASDEENLALLREVVNSAIDSLLD